MRSSPPRWDATSAVQKGVETSFASVPEDLKNDRNRTALDCPISGFLTSFRNLVTMFNFPEKITLKNRSITLTY